MNRQQMDCMAVTPTMVKEMHAVERKIYFKLYDAYADLIRMEGFNGSNANELRRVDRNITNLIKEIP